MDEWDNATVPRWQFVAFVCLMIFSIVFLVLTGPAKAAHTGGEFRACASFNVVDIITGSSRTLRLASGGNGNCAADEAVWEADAGAVFTLTWDQNTNGAVPPEIDTIDIDIIFDDTAIVVRNLANDIVPPADGTTFTFSATSDGTAGGTAAAGMYRVRITGVNDEVVNANDWACTSDGIEVVGASRDCEQFFAGAVRSCMFVSSVTVPAPPSGTTYALGVSADESFTTTVTRTRDVRDLASQDLRITTIQGGTDTLVEDGGAQDATTGATTTDSFVVDDTYGFVADFGTTTVGVRFNIEGNAVLINPGAVTWTRFCAAGHGSGVTRDSDTQVRDTDTNNANGHARIDADGSGTFDSNVDTDEEVYNRVEAVVCDFFVFNARLQQVTRSSTVTVRSAADVAESTQTRSGANYLCSYTTAAGNQATADTTGSPKTVRWVAGGSTANSGAAQFGVSSLFFVDAHTQIDATLVQDDFPNENQFEDFVYIAGEDIIHGWGHVVGVRKDRDIDTNGNANTRVIRDASGTTVASDTHDTGPDGWGTASLDAPATAPTGTWEFQVTVSFQGNSGTDIQEFSVASAFTANKVLRLAFDMHLEGDTREVRIWLFTELNDEPFVPDEVPLIRIGGVFEDGDSWSELIPFSNMTNAVDETQTVNGPLYFYDWTNVTDGNWNVWTQATLSGAAIRDSEIIKVEPMTSFEESVGMTVNEIAFFPLLAVAGILFWSRSTDLVVKVFSSMLVLVSGLLFLAVGLDADPRWEGTIPFAAMTCLAGIYLFVRCMWDEFAEASL